MTLSPSSPCCTVDDARGAVWTGSGVWANAGWDIVVRFAQEARPAVILGLDPRIGGRTHYVKFQLITMRRAMLG
jgi:hypothetical protein